MVPGAPVGKQRPRWGNGNTYTPRKTKEYEDYVASEYKRQCDGYRFLTDSPLRMVVTAYFAPPKSTSKKLREKMLSGEIKPTKRPDADNILKIVQDGLNGVAYQDDKSITDSRVVKRYGAEERVEVYIEEDLI